MRTISKGNPPDCLAKQPQGQEWETFMGTPCHGAVRGALVREQEGLCCYCESALEGQGGHIEHLAPRKHDPDKIYNYCNLACSCNGGTGNDRHCGHFKGNHHDPNLFASPHDPQTENLFTYLLDGSVVPNHSCPQADVVKARYMIDLLNLNAPRLKDRRRNHGRNLQQMISNASLDYSILSWAKDYYLSTTSQGTRQPFPSLSQILLNP